MELKGNTMCECGKHTEHKYCKEPKHGSDVCYKRAKAQRHRDRKSNPPSVTPSSNPNDMGGAFNRGLCHCGKDAYFGSLCTTHYTEALIEV